MRHDMNMSKPWNTILNSWKTPLEEYYYGSDDPKIGLGRCYRELREFKKAEGTLQRFLKAQPYHPKALHEMALVYWGMGKKEKALEHLNKCLFIWEEADADYKPAKLAREKLAERTM